MSSTSAFLSKTGAEMFMFVFIYSDTYSKVFFHILLIMISVEEQLCTLHDEKGIYFSCNVKYWHSWA